jgi:hypothetical protein
VLTGHHFSPAFVSLCEMEGPQLRRLTAFATHATLNIWQ